jgi:uncharacterized RDD family membrane protein YckC
VTTDSPPGGPAERGYLSAESKRRFTILAGVLGALFFLAQTLLPMIVMFLVMMPVMFSQEITTIDVDQAAVVGDELRVVEQTVDMDWRSPDRPVTRRALRALRLADLGDAGAPVPLRATGSSWDATLLAIDRRLWILGEDAVGYQDGAGTTWLAGTARPRRASRPFAYRGAPAVIVLGPAPKLATLQVTGGSATWAETDLPLDLPADAGALRAVQAIESDGELHLFAQLCTEDPDHCSLRHRVVGSAGWRSLIEEDCSCGTWTAVSLPSGPAIVLQESGRSDRDAAEISVTAIAGGETRRYALPRPPGRLPISGWRPLPAPPGLVFVTQGFPGNLRTFEWKDGQVGRSLARKGASPFPFGRDMVALMTIPQLLPVALSLVLAFILSALMRRDRVLDYEWEGRRVPFAPLWRRALAQLVDIVPITAGFLLPMSAMMEMFADPEQMIDAGPTFPLVFMAYAVGSVAWAVLVLGAYSYFEGKTGRTPGKWLLGIRVLGTDLRPCGFGRALIRNLLTFIDGFFSFLVGALMVALTENWQRLGDLAARTVVVADESQA